MLISDTIIENYKAAEIARDHNMSEQEAAATWFRETLYEEDFNEHPKPTYSRFVLKIDEEISLYIDYYAGYYFAVKS